MSSLIPCFGDDRCLACSQLKHTHTRCKKNEKKSEAGAAAELPQCSTLLRTDDADLLSLTARAPSASQSDETEMNGAASTMCVCVCVCVHVCVCVTETKSVWFPT